MNRFKKKNTIIMEALKLFSRQGFYTTKLTEISESLGISVGSIYTHFPSKNSLAKAAIRHVTRKLASELRYINERTIPVTEKVEKFVVAYFTFVSKHPEMIEYFFRVYLSNREIFCDEDDCGFSLAVEFIDEVERLIDDGVESGVFSEQDFYVAFSVIGGILGGMTFLNGEEVLDSDLSRYHQDVADKICKALG